MNKEYNNNLPLKLKMLRLDAGLSQEEFAAMVGISRSCVANYETGKRCPDIQTIQKIAEIYGIMTDALIGNDACESVTMRETLQANNEKWKKLLHTHSNLLDISHLPTEYKISVIECYKYVLKKHKKKEHEQKRLL